MLPTNKKVTYSIALAVLAIVLIFMAKFLFSTTKYSENANENKFVNGLALYKEKRYSEAFPLFQESCEQHHNILGCVHVGICYSMGYGVNRNTNAALEIFHKFSDKSNLSKFMEAQELEYHVGTNSSIGTASKLYAQLQNSNIDWIATKSKNGLQRKYVYDLLKEFLQLNIAFTNRKISYDQLEHGMLSLSTNGLSRDLYDKFSAFRTAYLNHAKEGDQILLESITPILKNTVSGLASSGKGGAIIGAIQGIWESGKILFGNSTKAEYANKLSNIFYDQLSKERISGTWYRNYISELNNKYNR